MCKRGLPDQCFDIFHASWDLGNFGIAREIGKRTPLVAKSTDVLWRTTLVDIWTAEGPARGDMGSCTPEP